jgi:tRNA modification GTPase
VQHHNDTIVALSTAQGSGAIAVIRLSGENAISIVDKCFSGDLQSAQTHTVHFGTMTAEGKILDEVVCAVFKAPKSYTGENIVEISCHGSAYITAEIINLLVQHGARLATAGEFTQRAFLSGKLDLSQAEAVADLIASDNAAQHQMALQQLRGGYSAELQQMREQLINFCALIELELDFSQEDVEFADRSQLEKLLEVLLIQLKKLAETFALGNAIKKGIPVAIVGKPNAGKSTLLNALLKEDRAIVSSIAGTTRDTIEDVLNIQGISYRFIDTAGLRDTTDEIESKGIARSLQKIKEAQLILLVCDVAEQVEDIVEAYKTLAHTKEQQVIIVLNKTDVYPHQVCNAYDVEEAVATLTRRPTLAMSAHTNFNVEKLLQLIVESTQQHLQNSSQLIVSNARHFHALNKTIESLQEVQEGMQNNISGDLLSIDIKGALNTLGSITGHIEVDRDILGTIFGKFCIGK